MLLQQKVYEHHCLQLLPYCVPLILSLICFTPTLHIQLLALYLGRSPFLYYVSRLSINAQVQYFINLNTHLFLSKGRQQMQVQTILAFMFINTYIFTLTLTHGAEPFLRSYQLCSHSHNLIFSGKNSCLKVVVYK
jgi:hypothetical protein